MQKHTLNKFRKNCMGTVTFDGLFAGMRKVQEFDVYPIKAGEQPSHLKVQSDTRIGYISLVDGAVEMAGPFSSGAYDQHLRKRKPIGQLSSEDLLLLKSQVLTTAHGAAGKAENGVIQTDNSGAIEVFAGAV